jgi:hypothetical protein
MHERTYPKSKEVNGRLVVVFVVVCALVGAMAVFKAPYVSAEMTRHLKEQSLRNRLSAGQVVGNSPEKARAILLEAGLKVGNPGRLVAVPSKSLGAKTAGPDYWQRFPGYTLVFGGSGRSLVGYARPIEGVSLDWTKRPWLKTYQIKIRVIIAVDKHEKVVGYSVFSYRGPPEIGDPTFD